MNDITQQHKVDQKLSNSSQDRELWIIKVCKKTIEDTNIKLSPMRLFHCREHESSQIGTRGTRNVNQVVSSMKERSTCFLPRRLGVDVVNDLVTFALCRARPHPNPQIVYPRLSLPRSVYLALFLSQANPQLGEISPVLHRLLTSNATSVRDHTRSQALRLQIFKVEVTSALQKSLHVVTS